MGGLFLMFIFLLLVIVTITMLVSVIFTRKSTAGYSALILWGTAFLFGFTMHLGKIIRVKKVLEKDDFYGEYIIDRDYFSGKQSDWQYNRFRFEIKKNDSIYFYVIEGQKNKETYKGLISTVATFRSKRIVFDMEKPNHHVLTTNPTIYREQ